MSKWCLAGDGCCLRLLSACGSPDQPSPAASENAGTEASKFTYLRQTRALRSLSAIAMTDLVQFTRPAAPW
jgi:hypothetical protein